MMNRIAFYCIFIFTIASTSLQAQTELQVLSFLKSISGKQIVMAQHNREPNAEPAKWTEQIKKRLVNIPPCGVATFYSSVKIFVIVGS